MLNNVMIYNSGKSQALDIDFRSDKNYAATDAHMEPTRYNSLRSAKTI